LKKNEEILRRKEEELRKVISTGSIGIEMSLGCDEHFIDKLRRTLLPFPFKGCPNIPGVYFIRTFNSDGIKIGYTKNIEQRVSHLNLAHPHPLKLMAIIPNGGGETELLIHSLFDSERIRGEWFRESANLVRFIFCIRKIYFLQGEIDHIREDNRHFRLYCKDKKILIRR